MKRGLKQTLRGEVRDVLLTLLRDPEAGAAARASAARTLIEMEREDGGVPDEQPATEMSVSEIDAEIARIKKR